MKKDFKSKKLTKTEEELLKRILGYFDERMLNLVAQFRGLAIASKISGEEFFKAFTDDVAQDKFFADLHAAEDKYNKEILESQKTLKNAQEITSQDGTK